MKIIEYGKQNSKIIMFLHGGGLSWWNYKSEAELLSDHYHVVLPILDGHSGSDSDFISIEKNAKRIIDYIEREYNGSVFAIGGLSLGAQILIEMINQKCDICSYAIIESASVIPSRVTEAVIGPVFSFSYGLTQKKWFSKIQFRYLRIKEDLFDYYYKDTSEITKNNLIEILKASTSYEINAGMKYSNVKTLIMVGAKENKKMICSAKRLHKILFNSRLEIYAGLSHGELSVNYPKQYVKKLLYLINR